MKKYLKLAFASFWVLTILLAVSFSKVPVNSVYADAGGWPTTTPTETPPADPTAQVVIPPSSADQAVEGDAQTGTQGETAPLPGETIPTSDIQSAILDPNQNQVVLPAAEESSNSLFSGLRLVLIIGSLIFVVLVAAFIVFRLRA